MSPFIIGLVFAFVTAIVVIVADAILKLAADRAEMVMSSSLVVVGCGLYVASALLWFFAMRHIPLSSAAVAYSGFTLLGASFVGAIVFGEPFRPREITGLSLALVAVVLMMPAH